MEGEGEDAAVRGLRPDCTPEHRVYFSEAGYVLGRPMPEVAGVTGTQMVIGEQVVSKKRGRA